MSTQPAAPTRKGVAWRTILLVLLAVLVTAFAFKNWGPVVVWPLGPSSLTMVIFISFVLGALIGWLAKSLTMHAK